MQIRLMMTAGVLAAGVMLGRETVVVSAAPKPVVIEYHKTFEKRVPVAACKILAGAVTKREQAMAIKVSARAVKP